MEISQQNVKTNLYVYTYTIEYIIYYKNTLRIIRLQRNQLKYPLSLTTKYRIHFSIFFIVKFKIRQIAINPITQRMNKKKTPLFFP